ncbi:MAG: molybdenum cofactor guanylyltransferase [Ilumatobacteraceae bacterium]
MARSAAVLGAVLVGGQSRRMGRDKALIEVGGSTMVDRTAAMLTASGCRPVVAIGPAHLTGSAASIPDSHPGEGPLGAIITSLSHAISIGADAAFVVACDLPGLDVATLVALLDARDPDRRKPSLTIAVTSRREPLIAIWNTACLAALDAAFDGGERSVHRAIDTAAELLVVGVPVDSARVRNVNTPDQLLNE